MPAVPNVSQTCSMPKRISWKYYSPRVAGSTGAVWNAFDAIEAVRYGSDWKLT